MASDWSTNGKNLGKNLGENSDQNSATLWRPRSDPAATDERTHWACPAVMEVSCALGLSG